MSFEQYRLEKSAHYEKYISDRFLDLLDIALYFGRFVPYLLLIFLIVAILQ